MDPLSSPDDVLRDPVRYWIHWKGSIGIAEPCLRTSSCDDMGSLRDSSQEGFQYPRVCKSPQSRNGAIALRSSDMDSFTTLSCLFRTRVVYVAIKHQSAQSDVKHHGEWKHYLELSLLSILYQGQKGIGETYWH